MSSVAWFWVYFRSTSSQIGSSTVGFMEFEELEFDISVKLGLHLSYLQQCVLSVLLYCSGIVGPRISRVGN